jgi:hemerythrin-like domain-containing protein
MLATDDLKHEHLVVIRMLTILESAVNKNAKDLPADFFSRTVDFLRNFVDKCHHGKEEEHLFPAMEAHGIPGKTGIIAVMLAEHEQGRGLVRQIDEAIKRIATDRVAFETAIGSALEYTKLLRQHINKETNIAFPMADGVFTEDDNRDLLEKFEEIEHERIGPGKHEGYLRLIDELETAMNIKSRV